MPITDTSHPYRVKIAGKIVAFPASLTLAEVENACRKLSTEGRQKPQKIVKSAPKTASKIAISSKPTTVPDDPQTVANRLSEMLDADPKTISEEDKEKIFQAIIGYRKQARALPDETRSVLDRKIASFSNRQVKPKAAKKK